MPFPSDSLFPGEKLFPGEGVPPETFISKGPSDSPASSVAIFFLASPADSTFEARIDGGIWVPAVSPLAINGLSGGRHLVEVRAISPEGVTDPDPARWEWRVQGAREIDATVRAQMDVLPGWAQFEPLYRATAIIAARESALMLQRLGEVRDGLIPNRRGNRLLEAWEVLVKLPRNPAGKTTDERWDAVIGRLRRAIEDPSGISWVARVTEQIGEGWTYVEEAPNIIRVTVSWGPGTERYLLAERVLLRMIPAAWRLILESTEGFLLDISKLDKETFHSK